MFAGGKFYLEGVSNRSFVCTDAAREPVLGLRLGRFIEVPFYKRGHIVVAGNLLHFAGPVEIGAAVADIYNVGFASWQNCGGYQRGGHRFATQLLGAVVNCGVCKRCSRLQALRHCAGSSRKVCFYKSVFCEAAGF